MLTAKMMMVVVVVVVAIRDDRYDGCYNGHCKNNGGSSDTH